MLTAHIQFVIYERYGLFKKRIIYKDINMAVTLLDHWEGKGEIAPVIQYQSTKSLL